MAFKGKNFIIIVAAFFYVLLPSQAAPASSSGPPDYWPTNGWRTTTPEEQGMNSGMLVDMVRTIRDQELNVDSITIVRNGYVVMDNYFYPFPENAKHSLRSASKSVMSILIGIAIEKKYIKDVNQPVLSFFPDRTIANMDDNKKKITVENLLTMTTGLECVDGHSHGNRGLYAMWRSKDWAQYVLDLPMIDDPGDRFEYCSGATYLLSFILQETTGMRSLDFAGKYLFPPLGITDAHWETNPQGIDYGYDQLLLKPRDMAKIGWLYLNRGEWDDGQVVPAAWVIDSSRGHIDAELVADQYGYQWWVEKDYYMAVGSGGQYILISPGKNMVAVITAAAPMLDKFLEVKKLFKSHILPSAVSETPLPPNPGDQKRLDDMLGAVRPRPVKKPVSPLPKISETVSGRKYVFGSNLLGLQSLTLTFQPNSDEASMSLVIMGKERELSVGLDNIPRITKIRGRLFAYKGAWEDDNLFIYHYRYVDDSNFGVARLEFKGEELIFAAHHKTNDFTYRATGRPYETNPVIRWWAEKKPIVMKWLKKYVGGLEDRTPEIIDKDDILGAWKGTDSYSAMMTFTFKEDGSFSVIRIPTVLGNPSIGKYTISAKELSGETDDKVTFTANKFGNEISGRWVYKVNGATASFLLKREASPPQHEAKTD